jgi:hypothetical protein
VIYVNRGLWAWNSKIGANAVLAPGTLLPPKTIIRRLQLVDQTLGSDSL